MTETRTTSYKAWLDSVLTNPREALSHLKGPLYDEDKSLIAIALQDIARSREIDITSQMEWVSVKDGLPTKTGPIAVMIGGKMFSSWSHSGCYLSRRGNRHSGITSFDMYEKKWYTETEYKDPSHWCYLPKLPEVK